MRRDVPAFRGTVPVPIAAAPVVEDEFELADELELLDEEAVLELLVDGLVAVTELTEHIGLGSEVSGVDRTWSGNTHHVTDCSSVDIICWMVVMTRAFAP